MSVLELNGKILQLSDHNKELRRVNEKLRKENKLLVKKKFEDTQLFMELAAKYVECIGKDERQRQATK